MLSQEKKLLEMLSNHDVTFFIPPYQRNYEWTDEQCKVFLDDIKKTKGNNQKGEAGHFFGTVIYFQNEPVFGQPHKLVLIDGQQRITTTMLFLAAFRDVISDDKLKDFINSRYLKNNNASEESEYKIKLKQVETDWHAYKAVVLGEDLSGKEKNSAVYRNYQFFYNKLLKYRDDGGDITTLLNKGLDEFRVITIELQPSKNPWENPQDIFESMNSLGKPLSLADLVRNYLMLGMSSDKQEALYHNCWLPIERAVAGNVSNFVRDFRQLHSKTSYKKASEANYKELYGIFKKLFSHLDSPAILNKISEYSALYKYLLPEGKTGCTGIDYQLSDIQRLQVTTAYSFLLSLLIRWKEGALSDDDLADVLDAFRIYCLRRRLLGMAQGENRIFPTLAGKADDIVNAPDKKRKMFEILSSQEANLRLPNDTEIARHLETMNFYNFRFCKFYLALVEEKITKSRPDLEDRLLHIEHVMPQTLNDEWKEALGNDCENIHREAVNTIGNLTLIRHNQELGQKSFLEKKEVYENKAGLQIAKTRITDCNVWNGNTIKRRSDWIIQYILTNVLPIPDNIRKTNNFSITKERNRMSFEKLQLIGLDINFIADQSVTAHVINDCEVEFEGRKWHLSPLTREIQTRRGVVNPSGVYQGAQYWEYDGNRLTDLMSMLNS